MKRTTMASFTLLATVAFLAGAWYGKPRDRNSPSAAGTTGPLRYSCSMHPQFLADMAGNCPACGMRLVPVNRDVSEAGRPGDSDARTLPGTIRVSFEKQQILGIRTGTVEKISGSRTLRVLGRVAVDDTRTYRINAFITGWIRELYPNTVGSHVHVNQSLATFYAPEFLSPQQGYIYRLDALDSIRRAGADAPERVALAEANLQGAADILRSMGMHDIQIEELRKTRQPTQRIGIYSPVTGFVLKRNVAPGMRFEAGTEFYQIADLSRIWILADVFEDDAQMFKPGAKATILYPRQKTRFPAVVADVLPQFDPATRTLKVRLEADNPDFTLSPGVFVDVAVAVSLPPAITVPSEAVLDSGLRETVFVDLGNGYFEPRVVRTGWRGDDRVEVTKGLAEGERVVVGGNFMLDSESRLNAAREQPERKTVEDPVCGMMVDTGNAGHTSGYAGKTYRFCSARCKARFEASQSTFLGAANRGAASGARIHPGSM